MHAIYTAKDSTEREHAEMKRNWDKFNGRIPLNEFCGARTRAGTACKRRDVYSNGRCKLHGGLSTGPRTPEGKAKSARNGFKTKERTP